MTTRIYVVHDYELIREGTKAVLNAEADLDVVGTAATAATAMADIAAMRPDVVLVDLELPDGDALDLCARLGDHLPSTHCVVFTSESNDEQLLAAIRSNASGFLLRSTSSFDLVAAVRKVASGGSLIDSALSASLMERIRQGSRAPVHATVLEVLSPQERRLLEHLADGITNREVAARMNLAEKTVKNYVSNLLRKLNMSSRTEAAVFMANVRNEGREMSTVG